MSCIERFKKRQVVSPELEVVVGDITFKVARFSQSEISAAAAKARGMLRAENLDPNQAEEAAKSIAVCVALSEFVIKHVKGWNLEGVEFSKQNVQALFAEMDDAERYLLGVGYLSAMAQDSQKKTEPSPVSGSNTSSGGSISN